MVLVDLVSLFLLNPHFCGVVVQSIGCAYVWACSHAPRPVAGYGSPIGGLCSFFLVIISFVVFIFIVVVRVVVMFIFTGYKKECT